MEIIDYKNIRYFENQEARLVEAPAPTPLQIVRPIREYFDLATELNLDLILVAPGIAKIMDYKKFIYDKKKAEKEQAKKQKANQQKQKEVKFHIGIDNGDYETKFNHIKEFLEENDKVCIQVVLRGRERANVKVIEAFIQKLSEDLNNISTIQNPLTKNGNNYIGYVVQKKK